MPQLDITTFISQIVWLVITFAGLYFVMARAVLPSITSVLQGRDERITSDLDQAENLKNEAEKLEEEYLATIQKVKNDAGGIISEAHKKVKETMEKKSHAMDEDIAIKQAQAEQAFASKKQKALDEITDVAAELAQFMVAEIAGFKVDKKKAEAVVRKQFEEAA